MSIVLKSIIHNFTPREFIHFFREKNRSFKPSGEDASQYNDDNFTDALFIGEIPFDVTEKLIIYAFKVNRDLSERSGKKAQYEKGKRILKDHQADAGIFIFYDSNGRFRFSLIHINYTGTRRQWSSFKRFTYFVSPEETNKTFLQRIGDGDFSSLEATKETFSVEKVTKEFYQEIANWYFWALKEARLPKDAEEEPNGRNIALIRLITRLIFIWFMRQKGIVKRELFDIKFLKDILKDLSPEKSTFYLAILQNLFFATLNTPIKQRKFRREERYKGYLNKDYMNHTYFRHHSLFKDPNKMKELFKDIPFLNGGLFECLDKAKGDETNDTGREIRIDGFSDDPKKQPSLPNFLFFSEEREVDLNEDYGTRNKRYRVRGIINILSSYNFTIDENTPVDEEVALDPELLGRVFENLLASYNPETATTARKATGSYYTPREIVDYMVRESLKEYFSNKSIPAFEKGNISIPAFEKGNISIPAYETKSKDAFVTVGKSKDAFVTVGKSKDAFVTLFSYDDDTNPFDDATTERLINAIHNLKLLDPAVGSGAFPMGALHCLVHILHKLDPHNERWKAEQNKAVSHITDREIKQEALKRIEESFTLNELDYGRKLYLIQNCIYGVDIQPIAIQIAKLRFFISLLVDEKVDKTKPNWGIEPLPNLETKFVAANTLIGLPRTSQLSLMPDDVKRLEKELKEVRNQYFIASSTREKEKLKKKDAEIRKDLGKTLKKSGFSVEATEKIAQWDPYDTNKSANWFDPEWMFGIVTPTSLSEGNAGFDIVIGNPPYIQLQKNSGNLADMYKNAKFETFERTGDIYTLFYERGINLTRKAGHLCLITSNKWMRAGYGESLRKFFTKYNPKILIDLGPGIFESATVDTNILLIEKAENQNQLKAVTLQKETNINMQRQLAERGVILTKLTKDAWFIGSTAEQRLKEKIERIGKPLKDWDVNIYYGIKTGLNEAFIITTEQRNQILANCKVTESSRFGGLTERERTEAIIKPILRGRDIKRYHYQWAGLWVIFIPWHFPLHEDTTIQGASEKAEKEFRKLYPVVYNHLLKFKDALSKRNKDETGIRYEWYALQRCAATYYPEFEKEKVVWKALSIAPSFALVPTGFYNNDKANLLTSKNNDIKYLCALMNSKIFQFYFSSIGIDMGQGFEYKIQFVEKIPLPPITPQNEGMVRQIEAVVDKILQAKNQDPQADTSQLERKIDHLVYRLYDLTEEEIRIIEGNQSIND